MQRPFFEPTCPPSDRPPTTTSRPALFQEAGPTCLSEQDTLLICSSNSTRTQRAGVYEILYWSRPDRTFCDSAFFRNRVTPEDPTSETCRERLLSRNESCYKSCDRCQFQCNNALARAVATAWKCSAGLPTLGINAAARISDVGVDIHMRHGAVRTTGKGSIPEVVWPETHETLVQNDVTHPKVPRDCVQMGLRTEAGTTPGPPDEADTSPRVVSDFVPKDAPRVDVRPLCTSH